MSPDEAMLSYQVMGLAVATVSVLLAMSVVSARFWREAKYLKKKYYKRGVMRERRRILSIIFTWEKFYKVMYKNGYIEWFIDDVIIDIRNQTKRKVDEERFMK
jgi:hypothetical protein